MEGHAEGVATATVRSFSESKFGFAALEDGGTVFFTADLIKRKNFSAPKPGDRITGVLKRRDKGMAFAEVCAIKRSSENMSSKEQKAEGVVKFFNDAKGYGFVTLEDGTDIFFHATFARECGIEPEVLTPGRDVSIAYRSGPKGLYATKLAVRG